MKSTIALAGLVSLLSFLPVTSTEAQARPKCVKGAVVQFLEKTRLTQNGEIMCTVYDADLGGAKKLGASRKNCLIESYGICSGPKDEGWARLSSFKRIR